MYHEMRSMEGVQQESPVHYLHKRRFKKIITAHNTKGGVILYFLSLL